MRVVSDTQAAPNLQASLQEKAGTAKFIEGQIEPITLASMQRKAAGVKAGV